MKKVLVVDDQQDCSDPMARLLRVCGFDAQVAADGREALAKLESFEPELILLDLAMPGMDGFDFLRTLRGISRWTDVPVIVFTAFYNDQMHSGLRLLGVNDVFSKGQTDFDILISRISDVTGEKELAGGGQRRILLVEDDDQTLEALARLLSDYGYDVTSTASPAEAAAEAMGKEFDLAVVDLGLGDTDSVQLLDGLLSRQQIKSLGLTSPAGGEISLKGAAFSKLLTKPVPVDTLMETIKGMTE